MRTAPSTIPFAAAFSQSSKDFKLSNLCYNDITSGMTDCINPSDQEIAKAQSRNFLAGVLAGSLDAMVEFSENSDKEYEDTWRMINRQNRIADQSSWY